ncbi:MAG: hypothetical protein J7539_11195 [Niabella sp.]|nr:hypothetical protein [Niabella sp.]
MQKTDPFTIASNNFKASFAVAEAVINPPEAIYFRNWSAATTDRATGFHKPLLMQCLAIRAHQNAPHLFLITADLGWWINAADEYALRKYLLDTFELEASQLLCCLSHTHAGPSICSNNKDKEGGEYIIPYLHQLRQTMETLMSGCVSNLAPGTLNWEYGTCSLAANRDLPLTDGQRYLVGYHPGAVADDTLLFGHITTDTGKPLCSVVNYACHPTTLAQENHLFSPDFVGEMREVIRNHTGAPCLFLQGASGELAPMVQYVSDTAIADAHGRQLGFAALSVYEGMLPPGKGYRFKESLLSGAPLALWDYTTTDGSSAVSFCKLEIEVPLKDLPSLEEIRKEWERCEDRVLKDKLWRKLNTRQVIGGGDHAKVPVWIWKLGDGYIVAQPNEAYSYFQRTLRAAFPDKKMAVVNIANGYIGYLPEAHFYQKDIYSCNTTPYAQGSLERLTLAVIAALQNL